jgi:uncharacterized membrane protein
MLPAHSPVFEALIVPHRSLTRRGMCYVIGGLAVVTCGVALRFWLWGAWPVVAFSFFEVPLLIVLLAVNQRRARASELIMLDSTQLTVIRTDPAGRRKREALPAAWLRVNLDDTRGVARLILSSHGRSCEVGAFLHEPDKMSLFCALSAALYRVSNPRFDNPQLRDGS